MKTSIENITPAKALAYLARNRINRPLRQKWVESLAQQITSGNWQLTHQGIAIAKSGELIDGQHRLSAVVLADKAVHMTVATEVDDSVYKVTDCGLKRASHDRLHLVDSVGENRLLCEVVGQYVRQALKVRGAIPTSAIEDAFLHYADSWLWIGAQFSKRVPIFTRAGVLAAIGIYHVIDKEKAAEFCHGYRTGENLTAGSPVLTLRRSIEGTPAAGNSPSSDYWRTVSATRAHYHDRTLKSVMEATEDMVGNQNSIRLIAERERKAAKAASTRRSNRTVAK
jgi:hypothetical protein